MDKKKLWLIVLLIVLSLGSSVFAEEPGNSQDSSEQLPTVDDESVFASNPTPENFQQLPNPTADDLLRVQNPTLENFQKLAPEQQANYLLQRYNNDFAINYYSSLEKVGQNQELDEKYFSGEGISGGSRATISQSKEAAGKYFLAQFQNTYSFELLGDDFVFDAEKKTLTSFGKVISLEDYRGKEKVKSIHAVAQGFIIIEAMEPLAAGEVGQRVLSVSGDGVGVISYREEKLKITSSDGKENTFQDFERGVDISIGKEGGYIITGQAKGEIFADNGFIKFQNRRGTLKLSADGDFSSENAELIARNFYFDGAGEKSGKEVALWDHGDGNLGNIRGVNSVFIDRSTGVGITSQGQSGQVDENGRVAVAIHLDAFSEQAKLPQEKPSIASTPKELRAQARDLRPPKGDLGARGEVWVGQILGETVVKAKGKVDLGFYNRDNVLVLNTPYYRGENGLSELELKIDGETKAELRGKGTYTDKQYGSTALSKERQVVLTGGIQNFQDGASLSLLRKEKKSDSDILSAACFGCSNKPAISLQKNLVIGERALGGKLFSSIRSAELTIDINNGQNGLSFSIPQSLAGSLAEAQGQGRAVILGRNLEMRLLQTNAEGQIVPEEEAKEQILQLAKPKNGGETLRVYVENYERGQKLGSSNVIDFGVKDALGSQVVVTSEKNRESVVKLMELLKKKDYSAISDLEFESDRDLRQFLLKETRLDLDLFQNPNYIESMGKTAQAQREFVSLQERLLREQNIVLGDDGTCISPPDCGRKISKAIGKGSSLGYLYTAARLKYLEAQQKSLEIVEQAETKGKDSGAKEEKEEIKTEIQNLQKARKFMDGVVERKRAAEEAEKPAGLAEEEARQEREKVRKRFQFEPVDSDLMLQQASDIKELKAEALKKKAEIERKIERQKELIVERGRNSQFATGVTEYLAIKKLESSKAEIDADINQLDTMLSSLITSYRVEGEGREQEGAVEGSGLSGFAAKLALAGGDTAEARSIAAEEIALEDSDFANSLISRSYSYDAQSYALAGDDKEASEALRMAFETKIDLEPELVAEDDAVENDFFDALIKKEEVRVEALEKQRDDKQKEMVSRGESGALKLMEFWGRFYGGMAAKVGAKIFYGAKTFHWNEVDLYAGAQEHYGVGGLNRSETRR